MEPILETVCRPAVKRRLGALALLSFLAVLLPAATASPQGRAPGLIVFWSDSPWPSIWSVRPDGSRVRRILRNRQNAKRPRLSPDRAWVAFDGAAPPKPPLTDFDIQLVRPDGTGLTTLTNTEEWDVDAQWSPDGSEISFSRTPPSPTDLRDSTIWLMRRDGSNQRMLLPGGGARWSPDGSRLVYTSRAGDLFIARRDGTVVRRLTSTRRALEQAAGWSPDGRRILFTRNYDSTGHNGDVFVVRRDGLRLRKLARGFAGSWSPDGSKILYTTYFRSSLRVMNADGSRKRRLAVVGSEPDWG